MPSGRLRVAYADPPYRGCCALYGHNHPDGRCWNEPETHRLLIERLNRDFPDGWALSSKSDARELAELIAWAGEGVRVGAWVKPFAVFKPGVGVAYAWEPVLFKGGRRRGRDVPTARDFISANVTLGKGLTGAKPEAFCSWVLDVLNVLPGDEAHDLFPGTGVFGRVAELRLRCGHGHQMRRVNGSCFACDPEGVQAVG